nr:hypothetical protein [uncultured Mediterraneibacter sp.]
MKKGFNHLTVYLGAVVISVLSILQVSRELLPRAIGIAVYFLAGVLLAVSCIFLYQDLKKGIVEKILNNIKKNPFGERFFDDYTFRTVLTTLPAFLINVAYTVYNGVIGIINQSAWFITMAVYYSLLGIMRYRAVNTGRKTAHMEDRRLIRKKELSVMKTDGVLLLLLNIALIGVIILTIVKDTAKRYPEIMVISIAAYTFYKIITSVINMIKVRKSQSPILITIRNIGVADALVSVLTLQMTMLASFQERSTLDINRMNAITGLAVCILISLLGARMIYYSGKRDKKES